MKKAPRVLLLMAAVALGIAQTGAPAQAAKPAGGTPTTYAGSAYALQANLTLLGSSPINVGPISSTGELPSSGGMVDNSAVALSTPAPLAIQAGILNAAVSGSGSETDAWASTVGLNLNVDNLVLANASVLQANASATCTGTSGSANIADLTLNVAGTSVPVNVSAPPNTTINLLNNTVKVIINEQGTTPSGRAYTNALHIIVAGALSGLVTADVVVSHAEAGITCGTAPRTCPVKDFVTGGGWITAPSGDKGTFGFVGGQKPNGLQGHLTYIDHGTGQKFEGSSVTAYSGSGTTRTVTYDTGVLTVADNGEPGTSDTFDWTSGGYHAAGNPIEKGNIQVHTPQGCSTTTTKGGHK